MNDSDTPIYIVYDGECPFCAAYVRMVRLREAAGKVALINARDKHPLVEEILLGGINLDEGMALKIGDNLYHGARVMNQLALMSGPSGFFNRLHVWVFSSHARTVFLYPFLRAGRNLALRILGRRKIAESHGAKVGLGK
ncbi:DCC1-like thiol-disulfide oxidoreductase family protein [Hyphococcus flavus]|uniref:DCC1-like thiol-disulfide oxidoreductase family protein n=1 Tax=Hyphococcus flavus TaxID=1866326 RepID=A0AAE9ZKK4_9PROT|nr:DCC1-like thiol-disulfide oxidoreductase family protein [Hyphococcus flavus]WDI32871.1 DCC1-like thiol-disulfide oxidoreductase family protein [Hyphococcus flavus]